jgi:hypothetical protein
MSNRIAAGVSPQAQQPAVKWHTCVGRGFRRLDSSAAGRVGVVAASTVRFGEVPPEDRRAGMGWQGLL